MSFTLAVSEAISLKVLRERGDLEEDVEADGDDLIEDDPFWIEMVDHRFILI